MFCLQAVLEHYLWPFAIGLSIWKDYRKPSGHLSFLVQIPSLFMPFHNFGQKFSLRSIFITMIEWFPERVIYIIRSSNHLRETLMGPSYMLYRTCWLFGSCYTGCTEKRFLLRFSNGNLRISKSSFYKTYAKSAKNGDGNTLYGNTKSLELELPIGK